MKTSKLNIKKILSIFVLLLVCSSMFMFVGCSNDGEKLECTSAASVPTFNYNKGWEDPRCTEYEKGQERYVWPLAEIYVQAQGSACYRHCVHLDFELGQHCQLCVYEDHD